MGKSKLNLKVNQTVAEAFKLKPSAISIDDNMDTIANWDSLAHIHLILSIEEAFKVKFPTRMIPKLTSVKAIQENLQDRGVI